jgi:peptide deformylase
VPGLRGFVERPQRIRVACVDAAGQPRQLELGGFQATVFQHEYDHLDGVLYVDRISDRSRLAFEDEYVRYHTGDAID